MRTARLLNKGKAAGIRPGYTLIELVASMTAATMLMTGLASAILISSSAFQMDAGSQANKGAAAEIQADLTADLQHALSFSERTANAVTFMVPDRDGDFVSETIRYAWSGTAGDPLTYTYNGGTAVTLAGNVQRFSLSYLTRDMDADFIPPEDVLFVTDESGSLNSEEQERVTLLESWGYTVNVIHDDANQSTFDTAFQNNDVVYVNVEADARDVDSKLLDSPIGVVSEETDLREELGLADNKDDTTLKAINIVDNTHYITSEFDTGDLTIFTQNEDVRSLTPTLAGGLVSLGEYLDDSSVGQPALSTLDTGAARYGGGTSTSRRVQLPWGRNGMDFSNLNASGQTIMRRSIDWAGQQNSDEDDSPVLIARWPFEEGSGQTTADATGNGNDGTLGASTAANIDDPTWASDAGQGNVLTFDGISDHVSGIGNCPAGSFTVAAWANCSSSVTDDYHVIYSAETEIWFGTDGGQEGNIIYLYVGGSKYAETATGAWTKDTWHHFAGTWDGTTAHIYVDGVDMPITLSGTLSNPTATAAVIGAYSTDDFSEDWNGSIDDVRLYDGALSSSEVTTLATP